MILTFSFKRSIYNFLKATIKFVLQRRSKRLFTRLLRFVWMLRNHIALVRTLTWTEWKMSTRLKIDDIKWSMGGDWKNLRLEKRQSPWFIILGNSFSPLLPLISSQEGDPRGSSDLTLFPGRGRGRGPGPRPGPGAGSREGESPGSETVINPGGQRRQTFS